jgi:predicted RNA-binding Zn-ribbon protein involved in translation (DUF1610 family)
MQDILTPGEQLIAIKDQIKREIEAGGDMTELPCPFCGLSRCTRSSYIRCSKCGFNWDFGTEYDRHPSMNGKPRVTL